MRPPARPRKPKSRWLYYSAFLGVSTMVLGGSGMVVGIIVCTAMEVKR